jgi:hypothetical protein
MKHRELAGFSRRGLSFWHQMALSPDVPLKVCYSLSLFTTTMSPREREAQVPEGWAEIGRREVTC